MSPQNYFKKLRLNALHQSITQNPELTLIYQIAEELGLFGLCYAMDGGHKG